MYERWWALKTERHTAALMFAFIFDGFYNSRSLSISMPNINFYFLRFVAYMVFVQGQPWILRHELVATSRIYSYILQFHCSFCFLGSEKKLLKTKIKLLYTTATASLIRRKLITLEVRNYNKINSHQSIFGLDIIRYNGRNMVPV